MVAHEVVSHDEWLAARKKHLAKEKEFTHLRDQLSRERRELPWELVEKDYTFEGERGRVSLDEMFDGRGQLVVYHGMFNPDTAGPQTTWAADAAWRTTQVLKTSALIVSFGEDDDGELYVVDHGGTLFRVSAGAVRRRAARP